VPILLVYAPILRPYILDLVSGNSLVEYLLREDWILDYFNDRRNYSKLSSFCSDSRMCRVR
jgi:poly(3-hydroxyalkanoate) synthetase